MKELPLFFATHVRGGGTLSFMYHLGKGLERIKVKPVYYAVGTTHLGKEKPQGKGIVAKHITVEEAVKIAKKQPSLIGTAYPPDPEIVVPLRKHCPVVVHGGTVEISNKAMVSYQTSDMPIITIRQAFTSFVENSIYIKYPYQRATPQERSEELHAVNLSRITASKRINLLLDANKLLDDAHRIMLYGFNNRMYAHFNLKQTHEDWEQYYLGELDKEDAEGGYRVATKAKYVIDMTQMKNDGGEPQFVHFEAMDAGARLILNKAWNLGKLDDYMHECVEYATTGEDIANILMQPDNKKNTALWNKRQKNAEALLAEHDAAKVAKEYVKMLKEI